MVTFEYGDAKASTVLIQPVDDHDMAGIEAEIAGLQRLIDVDFSLIAVKVDRWNSDLSPWKAPAVFGDEGFGDGAGETLANIMPLCGNGDKTYYLGGYSLAGLFSLWAAYQTDVFAGIAAASPSVWFPGFVGYMKEHTIQSPTVYLSLGDKEEKSRNPVMAKVGDCLRDGYAWLSEQGVRCTLEWNKGGHFKEPENRMARAFAWVLARGSGDLSRGG
ncbi:MAG: esterase [Schwartzia sp.]|nr:esterase [Schwartzia sp. (in: firmicutes)]